MKAVVRDPERLSGVALVDLPEPGLPGPGELLVGLRFAPINPADRLVAAGTYAPLSDLPEVIGAEGMGMVETIGPGVTEFATGDRVILLSRGNWAERRLVPVAEALRVADALPDEQAAILRINPATAFHLFARLALSPGDWLIQNAAGSSVARWVRRLAARQGLHTIDVTRSSKAILGSTPTLLDGDDLAVCARERAGGAPILGALDAVAGTATGRLADALAPDGRLIVYGHLSGDACRVPSSLLTSKGLTLQGFSLRAVESATDRALVYEDLSALAAADPEPIVLTWPLSEIDAALATPTSGRILLAMAR